MTSRFMSERTPEARLPRSDSRNPAKTCHGITCTGRPCRRAVTQPNIFGAALGFNAVYCWQHKEQADIVSTNRSLTSVDELVEQMSDIGLSGVRTAHTGATDLPKRTAISAGEARPRKQSQARTTLHASFLSIVCCGAASERHDLEFVRRRIPSGNHHYEPQRRKASYKGENNSKRSDHTSRRISAPKHTPREPAMIKENSTPHSSVVIPQNLPPDTWFELAAELTKQKSNTEQDGYIYMYLVADTPECPVSALAAAFGGLNEESPCQQRKSSMVEAMSECSPEGRIQPSPKRLRLKIGRASNVHRRLGEWTRQCGKPVKLARFYPYVPGQYRLPNGSVASTSTQDMSLHIRKVPDVNRVERLIHIELASKRVRERCSACGKEHREIFETDATLEALKQIDAVVQRWVGWAESHVTNTHRETRLAAVA